ncbi:MAG TPA: hypothetical protein VF932_10265 [Anaerolineae bacterium]
MSSFNNPHHFYLFAMKNGKKKLGYGASPEAAFENLKLRLTSKELEGIVREGFIKIPQRDLQKYARELG